MSLIKLSSGVLASLYLLAFAFGSALESENEHETYSQQSVNPPSSQTLFDGNNNFMSRNTRVSNDILDKITVDNKNSFDFAAHERGENKQSYKDYFLSTNEIGNDGNREFTQEEDNFYTKFDEVVENITHGVRIENTGHHKRCACTTTKFIFCNCSNQYHKFIPHPMHSIVNGLDLSINAIRNLSGAPFRGYKNLNLKYVSLCRNHIEALSVDSFQGLEQLLALDLRENKLEMRSGRYPPGVFNNMAHLIALRINKNNRDPKDPELFYPDKALAGLKFLRLLSMDGLRNKIFGEGFRTMVFLETLTLGGFKDGYCKILSLPKETFKYLGHLRLLNVSDCFLIGSEMDTRALSYLKKLHTIDFTWNERIGIENMANLLHGLKDHNLKKLFIERIERRFSPGVRVRSDHLTNLPQNLTHLVVSGNEISELDSDVLASLPKSLKYLDASSNKLVFGTYLKNLSLLENLETLYLKGFQYTFNLPSKYPSPLDNRKEVSSLRPLIESNENDLVLHLPPKLRFISMEKAGLWYYLSHLNFSDDNSLETLSLDYNVFPSVEGPFLGLKKLKYLNLSMCQITYIHQKFFEHFPDLKHLDLSGNLIGRGPSLYYQKSPFRFLTNLKYLNLNFNYIQTLDKDILIGLNALEEVHIQDNPIYRLNVIISHMGKLRMLNLNNTDIHKLMPDTRKHLDSLEDVKVYMFKAPLRCECPNMDFLIWMIHSKAIPRNFNYTCILSNLAAIYLPWKKLVPEVDIIRRECASNYSLFLPVLGATLFFSALIIGSVAFRFRWRIRYLYYGLQLWINRKKEDVEEGQFTYDVFLSYSSDDLDFVLTKVCPELRNRGLTLCVHSMDFFAGENIITNIIRCVKQSRRTLVVLTQNLIKSKWCRCEFQMAKEEAMLTGRKVLVFLLVEKIPKNKIGLELLTHIQENTYVPYSGGIIGDQSEAEEEISPASEREMKTIWDNLARDIKAKPFLGL